MAPQCLYPACTDSAVVQKPGRLLPVNFLCWFHALDEFAIKFVLQSKKYKQMYRDWGFETSSESECESEGSGYSARI